MASKLLPLNGRLMLKIAFLSVARSFSLLRVEQFLNGIGLIFVFVLLVALLPPQKLAPRRGGLLLLHTRQHLLILRFGLSRFLRSPYERNQLIEQLNLVLMLFEELVDLDIISDDLF